MAIRFTNGSSQRAEISTNPLLGNGAYTFMTWTYLISGPAFWPILNVGADTGGWNQHDAVQSEVLGGNQKFYMTSYDEINYPGEGASPQGSTIISMNTWYHICMRRSAMDVADFLLNGVVEAAGSVTSVTARANGGMSIGYGGGGNSGSGRFWGVKAWSAALTDAEIKREMMYAMPIRRANIYGVWPFLSNSARNKDLSGLSHDFTEANTPTDEDPPTTVAFRPQNLVIPSYLAAGGSSSSTTQRILLPNSRARVRPNGKVIFTVR